MSAFHDVRFPFRLAIGARGGPERRTEIASLVSGREERNTPWADSLRRWDAGPGLKTLDDLHALIAFFEARRGPLHGFRFRDPLDNRSCRPSREPAATDQLLGQGDGRQTQFQLVKHYESGGASWTRRIHKPVAETVVLALDGDAIAPAAIDTATGVVTLPEPPGIGAAVTAGYAFDCPVRFGTDRLDIALEDVGAGTAPHLPLIELRLDL